MRPTRRHTPEKFPLSKSAACCASRCAGLGEAAGGDETIRGKKRHDEHTSCQLGSVHRASANRSAAGREANGICAAGRLDRNELSPAKVKDDIAKANSVVAAGRGGIGCGLGMFLRSQILRRWCQGYSTKRGGPQRRSPMPAFGRCAAPSTTGHHHVRSALQSHLPWWQAIALHSCDFEGSAIMRSSLTVASIIAPLRRPLKNLYAIR